MTRTILCAALFTAAASAHMAMAATLTVTLNTDSNSGGTAGTGSGVLGDLRYAINTSNAGDTILFNCGSPCFITLSGPLPAITHNLIIDGGSLGNVVIDGADSYRVFLVDTGSVTLANLQIQNARAKGGNGGPGGGGGGLGAGAGLFINQASAVVSVTNCSFLHNIANGGDGDGTVVGGGGGGGLNFAGGGWSGVSVTANSGAGGGGSLSPGGAGGSGSSAPGGAGGNGSGGGGAGTFAGSAGGPGGAAFASNPAGGNGGTGNGVNGAPGGFGGNFAGGGGGSDCNPSNPAAVGGLGGFGGFGGGGGAGGRCNFIAGQRGGNGGVGGLGGGGGAGGIGPSGNNGVGAGGSPLTSTIYGGTGGSGPNGGGGGGAAAGPAIFVRLGALTTSNSNARDAYAKGGIGGGPQGELGSGLPGRADSIPVFNYGGRVNGSTAAGPVLGALTNLGLRFVPLPPCRIVDTRNSNGPLSGPQITGGGTRTFTLPGACGVPSTAEAYSLNVAVVPAGPLGYLTVWDAGKPRPLASTVNSIDGRVKSNAAIIPAGAGGAISIFATNPTDVVLDINGYFVTATDLTALAFFSLPPCRIADTRQAVGLLGGPSLNGGQTRTFPVRSSSCGIPATAQAYALNLAAVPNGPLGFLAAWSTGQSQPVVASLNAPTGTITANAAIIGAGTGGSIDVFATNPTDLVIDINGYFAPMNSGGLSLYNISPCRVLETRRPTGTPPFNGTGNTQVSDTVCGVPAAAQADVLAVAVVPAGPLGYLTLWPQGQPQPTVATLNAVDAMITSNLAIVPTTNGSISAFASNPTHLVLDVTGYFAQ